MEPCNFCGGSGRVLTRAYDRYGAAQEQRRVVCEYCGGDGVCEDGDRLEPATGQTAPPGHAEDLARRGIPNWS